MSDAIGQVAWRTGPQVLPFDGLLAVQPSPVDEEEQPSGIVLPVVYDGDQGVCRGVLTADGREAGLGRFEPGTVVYYRGGVRVRDVVIVHPGEVLAYEERY